MRRHLDYLDGWRGFAILFVLADHYRLHLTIRGHGPSLGQLGVDFFFVLSGRLMAGILFDDGMGIGQFYWRRFSRLVPAIVAYIATLFLIAPFVPQIVITPLDVVKVMTTTADYFEPSGTIGQLWSVCVEEHAYIVLALIATLHRRFSAPPAFLIGAPAAVCAINGAIQVWGFHRDAWDVYSRTDARMASILFSACICLVLSSRDIGHRLPVIAIVLGCLVESVHTVPDPIKYSVGPLLLAIGVNSIDSAAPVFLWIFKQRIIRFFGVLSFSIYLWQQPPIFLMDLGYSPWLILGGVALASIASFYLIEKPARNALNRMFAALKDSPVGPDTVWEKCRVLFFPRRKIDGGFTQPVGKTWRRRVDGKWQYQQDPETLDEFLDRQL